MGVKEDAQSKCLFVGERGERVKREERERKERAQNRTEQNRREQNKRREDEETERYHIFLFFKVHGSLCAVWSQRHLHFSFLAIGFFIIKKIIFAFIVRAVIVVVQ